MTIKKLIEQLVRQQFTDDHARELSLKLARTANKSEIKIVLDEFSGEKDG